MCVSGGCGFVSVLGAEAEACVCGHPSPTELHPQSYGKLSWELLGQEVSLLEELGFLAQYLWPTTIFSLQSLIFPFPKWALCFPQLHLPYGVQNHRLRLPCFACWDSVALSFTGSTPRNCSKPPLQTGSVFALGIGSLTSCSPNLHLKISCSKCYWTCLLAPQKPGVCEVRNATAACWDWVTGYLKLSLRISVQLQVQRHHVGR